MNSATFADFLVRSLAVGALAWAVARFGPMRGASRHREIFVRAALALLGLLPLSFFAPLPSLPVPGWPSTPAAPSLAWLLPVWLGGAVAMLLREAGARLRLRRLLGESRASRCHRTRALLTDLQAEMDFDRQVEIRVAGDFGPAALHRRHGVILLPEAAMAWSGETLRFVLAHELAHFCRRDHLWHFAARLICALQWFNPFAHALRTASELERELACDQIAARTGDCRRYGECLLALAAPNPVPALATALTMRPQRPGQLEQRIRSVLAVRRSPSRAVALTEALALAAAFAVLVGCSFSTPRHVARPTQWPASEIERRLAADPFPGE